VLIAWVRPADLSERAMRRLDQTLDANERDRAARFAFRLDRDAYVSAHGLLRAALSRLAPPKPSDWRFTRTPNGRPILAEPAYGLTFSLTHTRTLVACVVARGGAVGIDAEHVAASQPDAALLAESCSPDEAATIAAAASSQRARLFAQLWTRKEAAAKSLDLASEFQPQRMTFGADGHLRADGLVMPERARALTLRDIVTDERHVVTVASLIPAEIVIVHASETWVTFGPTGRDA
jgi:phosphopantetheinyl transferase